MDFEETNLFFDLQELQISSYTQIMEEPLSNINAKSCFGSPILIFTTYKPSSDCCIGKLIKVLSE